MSLELDVGKWPMAMYRSKSMATIIFEAQYLSTKLYILGTDLIRQNA